MKKLNLGIFGVFSALILSGCCDDHSNDQLERGIYEICGLVPHSITFYLDRDISFIALILAGVGIIFWQKKKSVQIFTIMMALIFSFGMANLTIWGIFVDPNSPHEICKNNVIDNWNNNKTIHENVEAIKAEKESK